MEIGVLLARHGYSSLQSYLLGRQRLGRLWFETSSKFDRSHLQKQLRVVVHICHPSYVGKHTQDLSPGWAEHKVRSCLKNNQGRTSRVAQVVEHLLNKCEVLSSNSITAKKIK
jgi:hypothetical protein